MDDKVFKAIVVNGLMVIAMLVAISSNPMLLGKYSHIADEWQAEAKKYVTGL